MSVGAVVAQVGEVLGRAHSLFGDPPASGQGPAAGSVMKLSGAGDLVRSGQAQMAPLSGQLATNYSTFAGGAGPALDTLAGNDRALSTQLDEAARTDRTGRTSSGTVVNGAAADTNGLAPFTNTPAGQKALLVALRQRVAQQQQVVQAYKTRDAQMAAIAAQKDFAKQHEPKSTMQAQNYMSKMGLMATTESHNKILEGLTNAKAESLKGLTFKRSKWDIVRRKKTPEQRAAKLVKIAAKWNAKFDANKVDVTKLATSLEELGNWGSSKLSDLGDGAVAAAGKAIAKVGPEPKMKLNGQFADPEIS